MKMGGISFPKFDVASPVQLCSKEKQKNKIFDSPSILISFSKTGNKGMNSSSLYHPPAPLTLWKLKHC